MIRTLRAVALLAVLAASCSADGDSPSTADGQLSSVVSDSTESGAVTPQSTGDTITEDASPLDGIFTDTSDLSEFEALELVAECMRAQGFEFVVPPAEPEDTDGRHTVGSETSGSGLGLAEGFLNEIRNPNSQDTSRDDPIDPNEAYVAGLSQEAQLAYQTALSGDLELTPDVYENSSLEELAPRLGCQGQVALARQPSGARQVVDEAFDIHAELEARVAVDPGVLDFNRDWSECMAAGGFTYRLPDDVLDELDERLEALRETVVPVWTTFTPEERQRMSESELEEISLAPPAFDEEAFARFEIFETEVVGQALSCMGSDGIASMDSVYASAYERAQQEFVADNEGAILALLDGADE